MQIISDIYTSTGKETFTHWGQTIDLSTVFGVIEVTTDDDSARDIGVRFVSEISRCIDPQLSIARLKQKIQSFIPKRVTSLILLVPRGNTVEFLQLGKGSIYMRRKTVLALLNNTAGTLTGEVKPGDTLLLFNAAATERCGKNVSKLFSSHLSPKEVSEALSIEFAESGSNQITGEAGLIFAVTDVVSDHATRTVGPPPAVPLHRPRRRFDFRKRIILIKTLIKQRPYVVLSVALGIFFAGSVFLGIRRQANDRQYKQMTAAYQDANSLFTQGVAVMNVDRGKSLELLRQAEERLQSLPLETLPPGKESRSIQDLILKISDNLAIVSRITKKELQLFYDASFLQKERTITNMAIRNGNMFILDSNAGMLAVVALENKNADIIGGGASFVGARSLAATSKAVFVLTDDGVRSVLPGSTDSTVVIPKDQIEGNVDTLATFGTNLYLLDKENGKLWRYLAKESGFEKAQNFFAEDVIPDLSQTTNLVIDGSVWFGSNIGKVYRYTQGRDDPFLVRNVDPALGQTVYMTKEDEGGTVYVLDPEQNRIVLLTESGGYTAQYQWSQNIKPTAIGVSELLKQIYVLADNKIYSLALQ